MKINWKVKDLPKKGDWIVNKSGAKPFKSTYKDTMTGKFIAYQFEHMEGKKVIVSWNYGTSPLTQKVPINQFTIVPADHPDYIYKTSSS